MTNTKNLETMKELLIKYASAEVLAKAINDYLCDIECSLDDRYFLNKFYVLDNNAENFSLLIDEFEIKTFNQIEQTYIFTCKDDNYLQPMKYFTKENNCFWIIRSLNKKEYYHMIENNRIEIINELIKHYNYINWNQAITDILEGEPCLE